MIEWDRKTKIQVVGRLPWKGFILAFWLDPDEISPKGEFVNIHGHGWCQIEDFTILEVLHTYEFKLEEPMKKVGLFKRILDNIWISLILYVLIGVSFWLAVIRLFNI